MISFLDTNVLVYAYDRAEPAKQRIAQEILRDGSQRLVLSTQVLGEFYTTVTKAFKTNMSPEVAAEEVARLARLPVVATDASIVLGAVRLAGEYPISYWDALIVEAAAAAGCDRILTEDLADGDTIRGVQIENPFAAR